MPRAPSPTDLQLAADLLRTGRDVSPRQIARWREAKILRYERDFPGRGRGSTSSYGPAVVDLASALHDLLQLRRSLRDATLILYGRGFDIAPEVVRASLLSYLSSVDRVLHKVIAAARTPSALRSALRASREGRAILRRLTEAGLDENAFTEVAAGLCGERESWASSFIAATGLTDIASNVLDEETLASIETTLNSFTLPQLRDVVERSSADVLRQGLADSRAVLPFVATFVELLARTTNTDDAPLLRTDETLDGQLAITHWSVIAIWARGQGVDIEEAIRLANRYGKGLAALIKLVRTFSFARGPLFGTDGAAHLDRLHGYEKDSITTRIAAWMTAHPDDGDVIRDFLTTAAAESAAAAA